MTSTDEELGHLQIKDMDFRRPALIGLTVFLVILLAGYTTAELLFGIPLMGFLEGAFTIYLTVILTLIFRTPYTKRLALAIVLPGIGLILAAMFHPDTPVNIFIWTFLIPVFSYAFLGRQLGFSVTLACSLLAVVAYLLKHQNSWGPYQLLITINVATCLCIIWVILHLYERYREKTINAFHLLATTDELTGLQNRRQMKDVFRHLSSAAAREQQALAVIVMDLDHFKKINDQWGHDTGDAVLAHVASLLRENLRKSDWMFRIGGEEFCLLLPVEDSAGSLKTAETIRQAIVESPCHHDDRIIPLSASIGVAVYPEDGEELEKLLQLADQYMYFAKQQGRNQVIGTEMDISQTDDKSSTIPENQ